MTEREGRFGSQEPENQGRPAINVSNLFLFVGSIGCLGLTLVAGRHDPAKLLFALVSIWVLTPFLVLYAIIRGTAHWSPTAQSVIRIGSMLLATGSILVYAIVVIRFGGPLTALVFFLVPPAASTAAAILTVIAAAFWKRDHPGHSA